MMDEIARDNKNRFSGLKMPNINEIIDKQLVTIIKKEIQSIKLILIFFFIMLLYNLFSSIIRMNLPFCPSLMPVLENLILQKTYKPILLTNCLPTFTKRVIKPKYV